MGKHRHSVAQVLDQHWCCIMYFIHLFPLYFTQTKRFFLFLSRKGLETILHISILRSYQPALFLQAVCIAVVCFLILCFLLVKPHVRIHTAFWYQLLVSVINKRRKKKKNHQRKFYRTYNNQKKKRVKTNKKNAGLYLPLSIISPSRTTRIWSAFTIVDNLKEIKAVKLFSTKGVSF